MMKACPPLTDRRSWALPVLAATLGLLGGGFLRTGGQPAAGALSADPAADAFPQVVAALRPSVVAIGTYEPSGTPAARYYGTGFVTGRGRTVVTNDHVLDAVRAENRLEHLAVFFPDRHPRDCQPARALASDPLHDLAVVGIEQAQAAPLELQAAALPQGTAVGMFGYPLGMVLGVVPAVHRGVVAAAEVPAVLPLPRGAKLTPELARALRDPYTLYQLDLVVLPGNSGSPLFDAATGRVVGIINKTLGGQTREHLISHPTGIGYAVPAQWIERLLAHEHVRNFEAATTRTADGS